MGIDYQNIAHQGAQGARSIKSVPYPPGGQVHDYVPFYLAPRSPMLLATNENNFQIFLTPLPRRLFLVPNDKLLMHSLYRNPAGTANDHDIVATAGFHQGLLDSLGKHTHGREDEDHQGHSPDGQERRYPARPEIAMNIMERPLGRLAVPRRWTP